MPEANDASLPRWAKYRPHKERDEKEREKRYSQSDGLLSKEDMYLREKAFQCLSNLVDSAMNATFNDSLSKEDDSGTNSLMNELINFLNKFQPTEKELLFSGKTTNEENDLRPVKKVCKEESAKENVSSLEAWITSRRYHPTILPLIILNCTPSILDRRELIHALERNLVGHTKQKPDSINDRLKKRLRYPHDRNLRPSICIIRTHGNGIGRTKKGRDVSDYLWDILTQCINQEQNPSDFAYLLDKQCYSFTSSADSHVGTQRIPMSYKDRILEWCELTTCFNSVVVIIENPEIMPIPLIDAFIGIISSLRSHSGVPISIVLLSVSEDLQLHRLALLNTHSIDGDAGVQVREFHTTSSDVMLDNLIGKFYSDIDEEFDLPVILPPPVLRKMCASFHDNHRSVVCFVREMKMAFAHHLSTEGSFLAVALNESFVRYHGQRIAWFCVTDSPREQRIKQTMTKSNGPVCTKMMLKTLQEIVETRGMLSIVRKIIDIVCNRTTPSPSIGALIERKKSSSVSIEYKDTLKNIFEFLRSMGLSDLLALFLELMAEADRHMQSCQRIDTTTILCNHIGGDLTKGDTFKVAFKGIASFRRVLAESIILVGGIIDNDEQNKNISNIEKDLRESLVSQFEVIFRDITSSSCAVFGKDLNTLFDSLHAEPRRFVASSIKSLEALEDCIHEHAADVQAAIKCFDARIISKDDWFHLFKKEIPDGISASSNEVLQRFAFAVYELTLCGLVGRSVGRSDSFEKKAMVWAV